MDERVPARITFGMRTVTDEECEIKKIGFTFGCSSEAFLTLGSTFSPTCNVEMENQVFILQSVHFLVEFYNAITEQWDNYGEYVICEMPTVTDGMVSFSGKGKLACIGERTCSNSLLYNANGRTAHTLSDFGALIYNNTGIEIVNDTGVNPQVYFPISDSGVEGPAKSYRYIIGFLALQVGGVATEYMGRVHIVRPFQYGTQAQLNEDDYFEFQHYDVPVHVGQVSLVCRPSVLKNDVAFYSTAEETDGSQTFTYGNTSNGKSSISIELDATYNPLSICQAAVTSLDHEYYAGSVKIYGNRGIKPTGFIEVQYGESSFLLYCMSISLEWDGGFTTYIETQTQSSDSGSTSLPQTLTQADIRQIVISMKYAEFEKLYVEDLEATNVRITGKLDASEADIKYAKIGLSNVSVDDVGMLFAKVGLIDRATIIEGHVTGYLDAVEVNANKITAGTLCTERLVIRGSNGSIIYSINNITGALQSVNAETINGEVLTDRTINADKIIASSITANELDVNNVFANTSVLNKLVAQDAFIEAVGANTVVVGAKNTADKANTAIQQLQVGARNLYIGTKDFSKNKWINTDLYPGGEFYPSSEWEHEGFDVAISQGGEPGIAQILAAKNGEVFTISGYVKSDGGTVVAKAGVSSGAILSDDNQAMTVSTQWTRMSATFHVTADGNIAPRFEQTNVFNNVWVCALKVERGNKATDYTPAPEDVEIVLSEIEGDLLNWCKDNDLTYIDGAKIYTRSIKAEQIDVEDVFAQDVIATGTITGTNIVGGTITGAAIDGALIISRYTDVTEEGTWYRSVVIDKGKIYAALPSGDTPNMFTNSLTLESRGENAEDISSIRLNSSSFEFPDILIQSGYVIISGSEYTDSQGNQQTLPLSVNIDGSLTVSGAKSRVVKTQNYGTRKMYCLETPTPIFSDFGNAKLDADGLCYIYMDDIFAETVDMDCNYNVSLTKYGQGELWVDDRQHDYFVAKGTPNIEFGWVLNAVQKEYESYRMEEAVKEQP